jgi:SprT protein
VFSVLSVRDTFREKMTSGVDKITNILNTHIPASAVPYCLQLWQASPFKFKLRKARQTKIGDFSCKHGQTPQITVNNDLHPYLFLITYVHEVAHLHVHKQYGHRVEAHGEEWKNTFRELMTPVMIPEIFSEKILRGLKRHMVNPKASTYSDTDLTELLRSVDAKWSRATLLSEIPEGSLFGLHGKWFRKGALQRTRVLCLELKTKRKFLVPADMPVENAQLSLL